MKKEIGGINQYIFAYGRRPSGRGMWVFKDDDGLYSEAKKQALKTIKNSVL